MAKVIGFGFAVLYFICGLFAIFGNTILGGMILFTDYMPNEVFIGISYIILGIFSVTVFFGNIGIEIEKVEK